MEAQTFNIVLEGSRPNAPNMKEISAYYYNIEGVGIMVYATDESNIGPYASAEFFTGRRLRAGETMQEVLDGAVAIIKKKGFKAFEKRIAELVCITGYANK